VAVAVTVAALGYFVDIYDLILFGVVRVPSLESMGLSGDALTAQGEFLLNMQMFGMLIGGVVWGVLGDRRGRLSVLFGSIFLYSAANLANGLITDLTSYAVLRLVAGIGLAGELGAGITLVAEIMSRERRGLGTTIVAAFGLLGAVAAGLVGTYDWGLSWQGEPVANWRIAYLIGGVLGIGLLLLRIGVVESGMFEQARHHGAPRGDLRQLFGQRRNLFRYLHCILIGLPLWFIIGILIFQSPEFGRAQGQSFPVQAATAIMICYLGLVVGDVASGLLSQALRSRRAAVLVFLLLCTLVGVYYIELGPVSSTHFYAVCFALGFSVGYWAIFVTIAAEQFGTNLRATVATTVPNFVRGSVVPLTLVFATLRDSVFGGRAAANLDAALIVLGLSLAIAFTSLYFLEETFGKDLNYMEGE
jgi:MFS family permease